jgi:hypothetical protein
MKNLDNNSYIKTTRKYINGFYKKINEICSVSKVKFLYGLIYLMILVKIHNE